MLLSFLKGLLGLADPISKIADARIAATNATTEQERIASEERARTLELRRDVLVKEAGQSNVNAFVRLFLAAPVGIVLWKVFVWDKALGQWTQGRTDALSPELWHVVTVVLGFYFLYEAATGVARTIKR